MSDATDVIKERAREFIGSNHPLKTVNLMTAFGKQLVDECIEQVINRDTTTWHRQIENQIRQHFGLPLNTDKIQCTASYQWGQFTNLRCHLKHDHTGEHFMSWSGGIASIRWEGDGVTVGIPEEVKTT